MHPPARSRPAAGAAAVDATLPAAPFNTADLSRRSFLEVLSAAGGAAVLASCDAGAPPATEQAGPETPLWVKDPGPFTRHGTNLETTLDRLRGFLTPNELFFVRSNGATPRIDPADYRLRVEGDAIGSPIELTLDEILALPSRSQISYLECAGNWRGFFPTTHGRAAGGAQWRTGAVGCAEWTGVALRTVLEAARPSADAAYVNLVGLDESEFSRPMPIAKALDPDTILAYAMNGSALPPDHGFPVRAVVPGWVGSNSVKWVGRIVVSSEPIWTRTNTTSYVMMGPDWPPDQFAPAQGGPITRQSIKSALALPWPASLRTGRHILRGFAHSPDGAIASVRWSADDGATWHDAAITGPRLPLAWSPFEFEWDPRPGSHRLLVRATDETGATQPDAVPFNELGYLLNVPVPHPVEVT